MSPKSGGGRKITKPRIVEVFEESDNPIMTTGEVVRELPVTRQAITPHLKDLIEEGKLGGRKASNTWFYWLPGRVVDDPTERVVGDELVVDLDERIREDLEEYAEENDVSPERAVIDLLDEKLNPPFPYWDEMRTFSFFFIWGMLLLGALRSYLPAAVYQPITVLLGLILILFIGAVAAAVFGPQIRDIVSSA